MAELAPNLYEGLFLLRQEAAASDFAGCVAFLRNVFERAGAEVLVLRKWDERRLAYDIHGQRRGIFLLAYFRVTGAQVAHIDRDCNLSEQILRCLIIRADHIGEIELANAAKDAELSLQMRGPIEDDRAEPRRDDHEEREEEAPVEEDIDGVRPART